MSNVGYATLTIIPSAKGFASALGGEVSGPLASAGRDGGQKAGGHFVGAFKGLVGPAVALAGSAMFAGFIRGAAQASDATDKFKATMSFAGLNTSAITAATKATKEYADQTVYDLPTIQNMTAQLASNGVKDYIGLTKAAGNLNAVAGGNAETFKSVAMVMTQTAGAGKLTTENWNQLSDAIPGAAGPIMKAMKDAGAYTGNFRDAMAKGEITSEEFNAALMKLGMNKTAIDAAKSTKTFEGAIGNLQATINSGLMGALDALKPAITGAINLLAGGLGKAFDAVGRGAKGVAAAVGVIASGDFKGGVFGLEEDSPFVGGLLKAHDLLVTLTGAGRAFFAAFKAGDGDITSSGLAGFLEGVAGKLRAVVDGAKNLWAGLTMPSNVAASIGAPLDGMVAVGAKIRGAFDAVGPVLSSTFGQIGATLGPLATAFFQAWTAVSPLQIAFQALLPFLPQIVGMIGQLVTSLSGGLLATLQGILPALTGLGTTLGTAFGSILAAVLPTIVQLVTMLGTTFAQLVPVIVPIITQVVMLATTLISQLAPIITNLVSSVMPPIISIFGAILGAIGPVISTVAGVLIPVIQALMPVVTTVFSVIASVVSSAMRIVQGIIQVVTGIISGNWSQVWSGIQNLVSGVWNTILALIGGAIRVVGSIIGAGLSLVGSVFRNVWNGVTSFLGGVWGNITRGVSGMIGNVTSFFGGLLGKITGAIGDAGRALWDVGRNIIQGLIDGIGSMMGAIGRAILDLVPGPIVGVFKDLLGIHSPSRVFRGFGVNIGEGLVLGIKDMHRDVERAVGDLASIPAGATFASPAVAVGGIQGALSGSGASGTAQPTIVQNNTFTTPMSEETVAELSARKLLRAGVGR